jgi:hypothetical protein
MPRSCEENIARRAWASARFRQLTPAQQLRQLMEYPLPLPVYHRTARTALKSMEPGALAEAIRVLHQEIERRSQARRKVREMMPLIYEYREAA